MVEREVTYEEENGEESDDEVGDEEDSKGEYDLMISEMHIQSLK